jgi:ankyrin repeat protein
LGKEKQPMLFTNRFLGLVMLLLVLTGCGKQVAVDNASQASQRSQPTGNQQAARNKLVQEGIPDTPEVLLERAKIGDAHAVELLLAAGINPNTKYLANTTALMEAALFHRADVVKVLLANGSEVNTRDDFGRTALSFAVQSGADASLIKSLLGKGADPNSTLNNGQSVLFLACDSPEVFQALLENGADANAKDPNTGLSILMNAVLAEQPDNVQAALEKNAEVNAKDNKGWSALMFAANNNKLEIARLLLKRGADVTAMANNGDTALAIAKRNRFPELVRLLQSRPAQKNLVSR